MTQLSDSDASKITGNSASSMTDTSVSPFRSRKSSLSAVIDKLRLQHNPEDFLPDGNSFSQLSMISMISMFSIMK